MKIEDVKDGMRVVYIPHHAGYIGRRHPDCEHGVVSSKNHKYAFIRFDGQLGDTNPACNPADLEDMTDVLYT